MHCPRCHMGEELMPLYSAPSCLRNKWRERLLLMSSCSKIIKMTLKNRNQLVQFVESSNDTNTSQESIIHPFSNIYLCPPPKSSVTSSPISTKGAQYLTLVKPSDCLIDFIARFRASLALFPSASCW